MQVLCCNMLYPVYPCYITVLWEGSLCCLSSHCMFKLVFSCVLTCSFTMWASVACVILLVMQTTLMLEYVKYYSYLWQTQENILFPYVFFSIKIHIITGRRTDWITDEYKPVTLQKLDITPGSLLMSVSCQCHFACHVYTNGTTWFLGSRWLQSTLWK